MKKLIAELPMLTAPKEKEELIMNLSRGQCKQAAEKILPGTHNCSNHGSVDKATVVKIRNKRRSEDRISSLERRRKNPDETLAETEELPKPWTLFIDGSSCIDGSGAGLILTNPKGVEFTYAMRTKWVSKNLQKKFSTPIVANLGQWILKSQESPVIVLILEGKKTLEGNFKEFFPQASAAQRRTKRRDALNKIASTSYRAILACKYLWRIKGRSLINEKEVLAIVEEEGHTWMTPICEYLTKEILPKDKKKARAVRRKASRQTTSLERYMKDPAACTPALDPWSFGLPREIVSDNGKQLCENPFKDWCEKLCIRQCFASVKHPQINGLVERANRSLGEGIKARLDERSKDIDRRTLTRHMGTPHND
ncbi:reverse transcriptase domain-containing protein [Tanacetum coccineum]